MTGRFFFYSVNRHIIANIYKVHKTRKFRLTFSGGLSYDKGGDGALQVNSREYTADIDNQKSDKQSRPKPRRETALGLLFVCKFTKNYPLFYYILYLT